MKWDVTTPGVLFERVKHLYPAQPEVRNTFQAGITTDQTEGQPSTASFAFNASPQEMLFHNSSRDKLALIGPVTLSVHGVPPYEGWEPLEGRLLEVFELIKDLLPEGGLISQCSIRYINRIELPATVKNLDDYLTLSFSLPATLPQDRTSFFNRIELLYPEGDASLALTWASVVAPENHSAFVLDLDLTSPLGERMNLESGIRKLRMLKERETVAFEGLILDRLREEFGEVGE